MEKVTFDIECGPNYFLVGFMKEDGDVKQIMFQDKISEADRALLRSIVRKYTLIGFNSERYDIPMLVAAYKKMNVEKLFRLSNRLVKNDVRWWEHKFSFRVDHIDIREPAPGVMVSLKLYGTRLHSKKIQDLPYAYDKILTSEQIKEVAKYNVNDLQITWDLYHAIEDRIHLREAMSEQYKLDLRSKSDAQIAEVVLSTELERAGVDVQRPDVPLKVYYRAPKHIAFRSEELQTLLSRLQDEGFRINRKNGQPIMPDWMKKYTVQIGETQFKVGLGGLHSQEKQLVVENGMRNADVASYYPSMMIQYGFYPPRFTRKFIEIYSRIYETRLKAKKKGDKVVSDSLKITLNGSFGKLGSMYSRLYAPDLMLQVTLTGQLMLLMLIEELDHYGIRVVSANTDGVEYKVQGISQDELAKAIIEDWEIATGMTMECGSYRALYARDVNNYVAVYDGYVKAKGVYAEPSLSKNSEYPVVYEAIKHHLLTGEPLEWYIEGCEDIRKFLTARTVSGGAMWRGQYLGKVVRWYYSKDGDMIHFAKNGNKVPKSDWAKPLMELPPKNKLPEDINIPHYIVLAYKHLHELGVKRSWEE